MFLLALIFIELYFCVFSCGAKQPVQRSQEGLHARYSDHMEQDRAESGILSFLVPNSQPLNGMFEILLTTSKTE